MLHTRTARWQFQKRVYTLEVISWLMKGLFVNYLHALIKQQHGSHRDKSVTTYEVQKRLRNELRTEET